MTKKEIAMEIKKTLGHLIFYKTFVDRYDISWETFRRYVPCERVRVLLRETYVDQAEVLDILNGEGYLEGSELREYYFEGRELKQRDYVYCYKIKY